MEDTGKLPVDVRVRRVILRYESVVSFLMPEGEFDASFEKRFGHFSSMTRARYNFLRGEMGFRFQNMYMKYRVVPQMTVYDKLTFVALFDHDRIWRREQGLQLGGRLLLPLPLNTFTNFKYLRYSFPSKINVQRLASQTFAMITQSFGTDVDSLRFLGFLHSGILEIDISRAFPFAGSSERFWQLVVRTRGESIHRRIRFGGELQWITLLSGETAPTRFLGGRNRLSAYDNNEFSGVNLFYAGFRTILPLCSHHLPLMLKAGLQEINLGVHVEIGQAGNDVAMRDWHHYHTSLGVGVSALTAYNKKRAFEIFFYTYTSFEMQMQRKYYFGIRL